MKWAAAFLRLATQVISKDESLDYRNYSGKIRDMLEEHVHATGLSTTIRLRSITDPNFVDDFKVEGKAEEELQEAFVRKSAELRRVTRELVDKNPSQYGRFSERVLEIIRRFEEGQIAAAEGLREFEDLTGGINAEQGAHAELGMDEGAFSILRIMETSGAGHGSSDLAGGGRGHRRRLFGGPAKPAVMVLHGQLQERTAAASPPHPRRARRAGGEGDPRRD